MDLARYDELLSAYLDRELSPDERASVDRLLERSSEARRRLHELEVTSRFMRSQPQHQLTVDFADSVIDRLRNESLLRPEPVASQPTHRRTVWWVGAPMAAAAALLVALGTWNYQTGDRNLRALPSPAISELAESSALSEGLNQWEALDVVEIRGPTGEKQFDLFVLARTTEPNTIKCILAESRDAEPSKLDSITPQNEPGTPAGGNTLAIVADQNQIDQLHGLFAQSDDGTGATFPLVDIVTDMEPDRIRVARVGPETRLSGLDGNRELIASRGSSQMDEGKGPAEVSRIQSPPSFAPDPLGESTVRRAREMPSPAGPVSKDKQNADPMVSLRLVVLPLGSGLPLVIPHVSAGESVALRPQAELAAKQAPAGGPLARKSAAALQDHGQRVPRITQINTQQQAAATPTTATQSSPPRTTSDHVEKLAKNKSADQPGLRQLRQDVKESPRRVEVLLILRNYRPE